MRKFNSLTDHIEEVLVGKFGLRQGSAITNAVTWVIFGGHSTTLVNYSDTWDFDGKLTKEMVIEALRFAQKRLWDWESALISNERVTE